MTELERFELAIEKGIKYDKQTGNVYTIQGNLIKRKCGGGYLTGRVYKNNKEYQFRVHRFIWFLEKGKLPIKFIDHIDGNRTNNKIENLRDISNQENMFNRKVLGYTYIKRINKYQASIMLNYKKIYLGVFDAKEDAHNAYLEGKKIYHLILGNQENKL